MKRNKKMLEMGYETLLDRWKNGQLLKNDYIYIADVMRRFEESLEYKIFRAFIESQIYRLHSYPKKAEDHSYVLGKLDGLIFINEAIKLLKKYDEFATKKEKEEEDNTNMPLANEEGSISDV